MLESTPEDATSPAAGPSPSGVPAGQSTDSTADVEATRGLFVVDDALFDEHRSTGYHPERAERLGAARRALAACQEGGLRVVPVAARDATVAELRRVHDAAWIERLTALRGLRAAIDDDTYVAPHSVEAALRAAGGAIALVDALLDAPVDASGAEAPRLGLALVRPPGHHATPSRGMGFCLLNNVALAAAHALARGLERVAIVDWDVHHGNGTQDAFYREGRVLFVSLHQWPMYPGSGAVTETGEGEGRATTVNIPLSRGAGDAVYASAFERVVVPALRRFAPELVLISAGFDAHARDPLAGMALTAEGYRAMAAAVREVAAGPARGRIGVFLEGGYDLAALEASMVGTIEGLLGVPAADPAALDEVPGQPISVPPISGDPSSPGRITSGQHLLDATHVAEIELARSIARAAGAL